MKKSPSFQIVRGLYVRELTFIADKLSQGRKKWSYDKRSRSSVKRAIGSNVEEEELVRVLEESLGKEMPNGYAFPETIQFQNIVLGPLGFLKSVVRRKRYDAETVVNIFIRFVRGEKLFKKAIREFQDEIPKEVLNSIIYKGEPSDKSTLIQLVLAYLSDEEICELMNKLLEKEMIKMGISGLYEEIEDPWIVTRHGLALTPEDKPVRNLANLVRNHYEEEDLGPELRAYSGDFQTKLLEYCIMESPKAILRRLFGLPELREIAKELGFVSDKIGSTDEVVALILLGLGFNVPPLLAGVTTYLKDIRKWKGDLSESREVGERSGIMSQVFVVMEKVLRDLDYFHMVFLWNERLNKLESDVQEEMPELISRQVKIKALDVFIHKKFRIKKPFERLGFGDLISLMKKVNIALQKVRSLKRKMDRSFGRTWILENKEVKLLNKISPYRSSFTHTKDYPGDEKCEEIVRLIENLLKQIQLRKTYPLVMRISREVSDGYGKSYAECIDENGDKWLLYTDAYLETSRPYFVHSKTPNIAVDPVVVEKIF